MKIAAKFAGTCKGCNQKFTAGAEVEWSRESGVTGCPSCGGNAQAAPAAPTNIDVAAALTALRARLNDEQRALASWRPDYGNARAVAAAGSGKTTTTVALVANLLEAGVSPHQVIVTTFTNKAGRELVERLSRVVVPAAMSALRVGTFHSLASRALRNDSRFAQGRNVDVPGRNEGIPAAATLWARASGVGNIAILGQFGAALGEEAAKGAPLAIESTFRSKGMTWGTDEAREAADKANLATLYTVWGLYEQQKKAHGGFDFHDLLVGFYEAVRANPQNNIVIVDEAQDNSLLQVALAQALAGPQGRILLVGDVRQAIYEWRGAAPSLFLGADQTIGASTYYLRTNYCSGRKIVELGNRVAEGRSWSLGPPAVAGRDVDGVVTVTGHAESIDEATATSHDIARMVADGAHPEDIAILCRTRAQQGSYEAALLSRKIPVVVVGGSSFFASADWLDFQAGLACAAGEADGDQMARFVKTLPGCGYFAGQAAKRGHEATGTIEGGFQAAIADARRADAKANIRDVQAWLADVAKLPLKLQAERVAERLAADVREGTGDDDRRGSLFAAAAISARFDAYTKLASFASRCAGAATALLDRDASDEAARKGRVTISTIHKAKGLEWGTVFCSASAGVFPHFRCLEDEARLEEEARLFYVAVTRAKDALHLTYARKVNDKAAGPSEFLDYVEQPVRPTPGPQGGGEGPHKATLAEVEADLVEIAVKHHGDEAAVALVEGDLMGRPAAPAVVEEVEEPAPTAAALREALAAAMPRAEALTEAGAKPAPGSRFVPVTWAEFQALLGPLGFVEGHPNGQRVLQAFLSDGSRALVYSTVPMGEEEARGLGEDSIRVSLVSAEDRPFSKRLPYAARTRNWRSTLLARLTTVLGAHPSLRTQ